MKDAQIDVKETKPLRWPEGWSRTFIEHRKNQGGWRKTYEFYYAIVVAELRRMGVTRVEVTRNERSQERQDPGVAVWFALKPVADASWQLGLQLDSPMPTLDEIDEAFKRLAAKHHPDRVQQGSGGDIQMWHKLSEYRRKARAWVLGGDVVKFDNCIPCDRFSDQRQNLAAVAAALRHFRGLDRVGIPAILERVMSSAFRTALPAQAGGGSVNT